MDSFPIRSLDGLDFYFTVCEGFEYNVEFSNSDYLFESEKMSFAIFDISFDKTIEQGIKKKDILSDTVSKKIRFTICKIIADFMRVNQCSVVFICDSSDDLHKKRFDRFQKWNEEFDFSYECIWKIYDDSENSLMYYVGAIVFDSKQFALIEAEMEAPFILSIDKE